MLKKKPPKCPRCGARLSHVSAMVSSRYDFDSATGKYKLSVSFESSSTRCPECDADLAKIFRDGLDDYLVADIQ